MGVQDKALKLYPASASNKTNAISDDDDFPIRQDLPYLRHPLPKASYRH